jgi:hypothetical protein
MMTAKYRVLTREELKSKGYEDMADLAVIFNHEIVAYENSGPGGRFEGHDEVWRWKRNQLICRVDGGTLGIQFYTPPEWRGGLVNTIHPPGGVDRNQLACLARESAFPLEEWMKYNMQGGYSLEGFSEFFGQHEVTEFGLEYTRKLPKHWDFNEAHWESAIEYMRHKYSGQVLKL